MSGLLADVTVVRIGSALVGDLLVAILRDQGAQITTYRPDEFADRDGAPAASADVLVDDCGPAVLIGRGLGPDALTKHRPDLVQCTFSDLPPGTPDRSSGPGALADNRISAMIGLDRLSGEPLRAEAIPVASVYGAIVAATYIAAALVRRDAGGGATHIDVPLATAAVTALSRDLIRLDDPSLVDIGLGPRLPISGLYECADGRYLQLHGLYDNFVAVACQLLDHPEWTDDAVGGLNQLPDAAAEQMWRARFAAAFKQRPAAGWEHDINAAGGAATLSRSAAEWFAEAHPHASRIFADGGLGPAVRVIQSPVHHTARRSPVRSANSALPLAGITVVDFCIILAGPTCGRVLAELGANVVKVDDPARFILPLPWLDINRGKRSILIDLRRPGGVDLAKRFVEQADVVLQNFRSGKMDELGLGYDQLRAGRPDLVYASTNAFDFDGPWQARAGWEHNAQAASGLQVDRAGADGAPRQVPFPVNDYATGLLAAFGVVLCLRSRARDGVGGHVQGSLARSATLLRRASVQARLADVDTTVRAGDIHTETTRRWMVEAGLLTRRHLPRLGWLEQVTARPVTTPALDRMGPPAPEPGQDSIELLRELGIPQGEIDATMRSGAIRPLTPFFPDFPASAPSHHNVRTIE